MENYCIDKGHESRLADLIRADGTNRGDMERISLFYIIAGNEGLYRRRGTIYDFRNHCINPNIIDGRKDFPSSLRALIKLGFNLFNGYREENMTPLDLFWNLDHINIQLAENAIRLRFSSQA